MDKIHNRYFTKKGIEMNSKHIKRRPTLSAIEEMQIKSTIPYHHTPTTMTKSKDTRCWQECGATTTLGLFWWGYRYKLVK